MSNQPKQVAVFIIAKNGGVEIIPISAIRKLVATATQRMLFTQDERNQPALYMLDTKAFEDAYVAEYGREEDEATHLTYVAAAIYRAVLDGKTFTVTSRHFTPLDQEQEVKAS